MAKDPKLPETRFPLRRPAEPAPEPRAWAPPPSVPEPPKRSAGEMIEAAFARARKAIQTDEPLELTGGVPPPIGYSAPRRAAPPPPPPPMAPEPAPGSYTTNVPVVRRPRNWLKWGVRGAAGFVVLFIVAVGWLALTAPLSKSLQPPAPPSITLLSAEGTPIARRGAVIGPAVDAAKLPEHVRDAFVAIEDRRFYSHWGVDPRGILRALVHNMGGSGGSQGGSTITQQLAKNAFLDQSRTVSRKFQEMLIAFWLEAWLTKDEILSRYLSNVYFGDNVYGLSAAAQHYFSCRPEDLTVSQATLLAGLVQAPSRLAPTGNLKGARDRQRLVVRSMVSAGLLDKREAAAVKPAVLHTDRVTQLPNGTYFADWVLPQARDRAGAVASEQTVQTTMEIHAQKAAERAVRDAGLRKSQIAIVAMHPDGRVIAMVGGTNYGGSPFNRATQARRQPGSTFKLFVYLAALRSGMTPDSIVDDSPVTIGGWSPSNSHDSYQGKITLRQAFAKSSNVVAARLTKQLGVARVTQVARDLGISTPIGSDASVGLGTSTVSLLELTAAYASIAEGAYPVRPRGLADTEASQDWLARTLGAPSRFPNGQLDDMRSMLASVVQSGTGRGAALPIPTFGKTGTTQDNRDALFIGYAGGIVAGVWLGNDDNSPNPGLSGSGIPARVWRDFMTRALDIQAPPPPAVPDNETDGNESGSLVDALDGLGIHLGNGEIQVEVDSDTPRAPPSPADERRREDVDVPRQPPIPAPTQPRRVKPDEGQN
ncbi:MAG: PBP1A family penicillin-binding protein [Sphingomonas sp.]